MSWYSDLFKRKFKIFRVVEDIYADGHSEFTVVSNQFWLWFTWEHEQHVDSIEEGEREILKLLRRDRRGTQVNQKIHNVNEVWAKLKNGDT